MYPVHSKIIRLLRFDTYYDINENWNTNMSQFTMSHVNKLTHLFLEIEKLNKRKANNILRCVIFSFNFLANNYMKRT